MRLSRGLRRSRTHHGRTRYGGVNVGLVARASSARCHVLLRAWTTLVARTREMVLSSKQLVMENYMDTI